MVRTYEAAVRLLRWPDSEIMECDLGRLYLAIESASTDRHDDIILRFRIAGFKIEEPMEEIEDDDEFNDRARKAMAMLARKTA